MFTGLFTLGALVQYNDPDSLWWILIYGVAAFVSLLFSLDKLHIRWPLMLGVAGIIGFIYLYPSNFQGFDLEDGDINTVELGREAFGLLIIALVMFLYTVRLSRLKV